MPSAVTWERKASAGSHPRLPQRRKTAFSAQSFPLNLAVFQDRIGVGSPVSPAEPGVFYCTSLRAGPTNGTELSWKTKANGPRCRDPPGMETAPAYFGETSQRGLLARFDTSPKPLCPGGYFMHFNVGFNFIFCPSRKDRAQSWPGAGQRHWTHLLCPCLSVKPGSSLTSRVHLLWKREGYLPINFNSGAPSPI